VGLGGALALASIGEGPDKDRQSRDVWPRGDQTTRVTATRPLDCQDCQITGGDIYMNKKFLMGLAPLLAIVAFAVAPAVSQAAEPCYTKSSPLCSSVKETPIEVYAWGTLTLKTVVGGTGEVTCHNAAAGTIKNPAVGKGEGETVEFATYDCAASTCPAFTKVEAESLPWPSLLEEKAPPKIRAKTSGVKVSIACFASKAASEFKEEQAGTKALGSAQFVGSNEPELINKNSASPQASLIEFDPESGMLEAEGSGGTVLGKTEGKLQNLGYAHQEIIHAQAK
jgi:hypothetical protein